MHNLLFSEYFAQLSKYLCLYFNATESSIVDKKFQGNKRFIFSEVYNIQREFCICSIMAFLVTLSPNSEETYLLRTSSVRCPIWLFNEAF